MYLMLPRKPDDISHGTLHQDSSKAMWVTIQENIILLILLVQAIAQMGLS